ncbi:unnamed protein product [Phyllotreta striolata]|uniref:Uncharacterized protein n=1 Tax=Phyllotreta striolata TaxID=444603 RepID=A0A9N9XWL1_PHYSR|nr:unnamed protein product [Phyllotreta striolata]
MNHFIIYALMSALTATANPEMEDLWREFKKEHNRIYNSVEEEAERFNIFQVNIRTIREQNQKYDTGESSYYMGINQFADLTQEEFVAKYKSKTKVPTGSYVINEFQLPLNVPDQKNWTAEEVVTEVRDQDICDCGYAIASIGAVESAYAIKHKTLKVLSVQQIVDCSYGEIYYNYGCDGGIINGTYRYAMKYGIIEEQSYPFTHKDFSPCLYNQSTPSVTLETFKEVSSDEEILKNVVGTIGPVAITVNSELWGFYEGGIFDKNCTNNDTNHVALISGYGTEDGVDYWYLRNSWGTKWGLNGYIKIRRNLNNVFCLNTYAAYPVVN